MGNRSSSINEYIDWSALVHAVEHKGDDPDDTSLVRRMSDDALNLSRRQFGLSENAVTFCNPLTTVGGIFMVVLVRDPSGDTSRSAYWIVVGDVPPIALPWWMASKVGQVVYWYIDLMRRWVDLVVSGDARSAKALYSHSSLDTTRSTAIQLDRKLEFLSANVMRYCIADVNDWACACE